MHLKIRRAPVSTLVFTLVFILLGAGLAGGADGAEKAPARKKSAAKSHRVKVEKLACRLGTEDEHARIAVELHDGRVQHFAYYSKWKPRTCSMDVKRNDVFSKWEDTGDTSIVTLVDDTGAILINHDRNSYKFIFRDIDRMRYCGMEGKVSGSLTIFRNKAQCVLEGVMDREGNVRPDRSGSVIDLPPSFSVDSPGRNSGDEAK
ncbi:MAG TPA: hypothetical protein VJQ51_01205 [Burkholderiales bacterium]|nr:hypothetical protein [Burkholderiales bacterium]